MSFKIKGMKELQKELKGMQKAAKDLEKEKHVSLDALFTKEFMTKNTPFKSFDAFLESGNFIVNSTEDFEAIPNEDMDKHVANTTRFNSWDDMLGEAGSEYAAKKLGF